MVAVAFDTFKFVNRLEEAGLPRAQAVAISEAQQQSLAEALDSTLATKADVARLEASITRLESNTKSDVARLEANIVRVESRIDLLHKDIQSMELRMEGKMEKIELRMTIKLGAMLAATAGIIISALKMLH